MSAFGEYKGRNKMKQGSEYRPSQDENSASLGNGGKVSSSNHSDAYVKSLEAKLEEAKHEAKLAAEIGQELLRNDQAKAAELDELRTRAEALAEHVTGAEERRLQASEALEEARAECAALKERMRSTEASMDKLKRAGLESEAAQNDVEAKLAAALAEAEQSSRRVAELQTSLVELKFNTPVGKGASLRRSQSALEFESPEVRLGAVESVCDTNGRPSVASRRRRSIASMGCGGVAYDSEEEEEALLAGAGDGEERNALHTQLTSARKENNKSRKKIRALESVLAQTKLEHTASARKVIELNRCVDEYKEMLLETNDMASSYKNQLEGGGQGGSGKLGSLAESMDGVLIQEELVKLQAKVQSQELLALIREDDLERTMASLMELEERYYQEMGKSITLRRRRNKRAMYSTCDIGVGTDPDPTLEAPAMPRLEVDPDPTPLLVERGGYSGPVLVKFRRKGFLSGFRAPKWKARICELRGPHLLFFTNEWDTKPCKIIPIDGTEVRVVRRPHYQPVVDMAKSKRRRRSGGSNRRKSNESAGNDDEDFEIDLQLLSAKKSSRRLGRQMSFMALFGNDQVTNEITAAQRQSASRSTRVMHEFHLWHPRRPAVYFSAPTHGQMAQWAEHIQRQSTSVAVKPMRHAAGYLTIINDSLASTGSATRNIRAQEQAGAPVCGKKDHLSRFFAVLRQDGLYLYKHPKKQTAKRVVLLDERARIWKPETGTSRKASLLIADVRRCFCISTSEQGKSTFLADTEVDTDWWVSTLKAHGMGIVSWGSLTGIRDDEPFGCLNL